MTSKSMQWVLWAIAMVIFLALALSGHTLLLGLAITAVALLWYGIVPKVGSRRQ
jgi:hypothetical protein